MVWFFTETSMATLAGLSFLAGALAGGLAHFWARSLSEPRTSTKRAKPEPSTPCYGRIPVVGRLLSRGRGAYRGQSEGNALAIEVATGILFAAYVLATARFHCQQIPEVQPDVSWKFARIPYHLALIAMLLTATLIDLRDYVIPDQVTALGAAIGLAGATLAGQFQMVHVWVDWNQEIAGFQGPYIPAWLDAHRHLHGLAWSAAGALVGAGLALFVRGVSSLLLKRESLGLGDATLMAMIGSFIGWQPTVFVFALAPLCGLVFLIPLRAATGKSYIPYGPFLAGATVIVLFFWTRIWLSTRLIFGHPPSLALLAGVAAAALIVLLTVLRFRNPSAQDVSPG